MTPLLKKMNFRGHDRILIIDPPEELASLLAGFAGVAHVDGQPPPGVSYGFILVFVRSAQQVVRRAGIVAHAEEDAVIWFAYPKKSSRRYRTDISRDHGWQPLLGRGFQPVRQVAIDEDWSALRFREAHRVGSRSRPGTQDMRVQGAVRS